MLLLSISCYKDEVVSVTNSNYYSVSYLKYYPSILQNVNALPKNYSCKMSKPYYMDTLLSFTKVCNTEVSSK